VNNKNNRITFIELPVRSRRSRAKGKKVFPISITVTQEQIDWLQKQPNASEIIRKLLQDLIDVGKDVQAKMGVISLNNQLKELQKQKEKLSGDRYHYVFTEKAHCWKMHRPEKYLIDIIDWLDDEHAIPKPKDNEESRVAFRVIRGYDDSIKVIELKMKEINAKILHFE
jgi:hypothetical protein